MGLKPPLSALLLLASAAWAEIHPLPPEPTRQEIREYRLAVREKAWAVRDSARRENNLLVGISPSYISITHDPGSDPYTEESIASMGFSLAYRTHFTGKIGIKAGSQFITGTSDVTYHKEAPNPGIDYYYPYELTSTGSKGTVYGFNSGVQAVFGPFGRVTLEPGLGISWGGHSEDTVALSGDAGNFAFVQDSHYSFYNVILGGSLYLGSTDQINISPSFTVGFSPGTEDKVQYQFNLALVYAVQFKKEK